MAKRAKSGGRKHAAQAEVTSEQTLAEIQAGPDFKAPTTEQVTKLVRKLDNWDNERKTISDAARESISKARENQHLDPLALAIGRRLNKLTDEKLAVTLPHLLRYIDDLKLEQRATQQMDMFEPEADELDGQTDIEDPIEKVGRGGATLRIVDETSRVA